MADGALSDLKVVEYADFVSGPFCGKLMADLGADVIKIEAPSSGDTARNTGPFPNDIPHAERSGLFLYLNTNKRSVTLDPATPAGADIFRELIKTADVLIENMPPGSMQRLGLDYESLRKINPGLVMTSVTPFGQSGPYAKWKGNDLICTQMSGIAFHTPGGGVDSDDKPPLKPGGRQSDFIAGSTAASATMFAVIARKELGVGQHVDVSQHESIASFLRHQVAFYTYDPEGLGFLRQLDRNVRVWPEAWRPLPCSDGYVFSRCRQESQWRALMGLVAGDGWENEERFQGMFEGDFDLLTFLSEWGETIRPMAVAWSMQRTKADVMATGQSRDVPFSPSGYSGFGYLPCKDGYVVCGCREAYQWRDFIALVVGDEWAEDDRFKDLLGDEFDMGVFLMTAGPSLWPVIVKWAESRTREEITIAAQAKGVPIVPCNTTEDVFESAHFKERQLLVEIDHSETGGLLYPGAPYHLSETPWHVGSPAPLLGQHNREILGEELGHSQEELSSMGAAGII
tara:strand:+ start:2951 stop:4489 length:1539 start_codon:yes stop_codon:yes gene_type:complete